MAVIPQIGSGAYLPYTKGSLNGTKNKTGTNQTT